jgi:4a-hydroxytetrahydrobiopterin dehydratase
MKVLSDIEIKDRLSRLSDWAQSGSSIEKEFKLKDFSDALAFTIKVGVESEKQDHHPDILIHSWNKVKITLSTHSAGGITEHDFNLAEKISEL